MRRAAVLACVLALCGCGGVVGQPRHAQDPLGAFGIRIQLPHGWRGRIVLGAHGRPVVHAASFQLPTNDTDRGEIAKESMGVGTYVNVRDLGRGDSPVAFPFSFLRTDFRPASRPEWRFLRFASRKVAFRGELYGITAIAGATGGPSPAALKRVNDVIRSLAVKPYRPKPVRPAAGPAIAGYGLHANLPSGWRGSVGSGVLRASGRSLSLRIEERTASDVAGFITSWTPVRLGPAEFVRTNGERPPGYWTGATFEQCGREFLLSVRSPTNPPDARALGQANALLASFRAQPGDFYPGSVRPATFASAAGWSTGTTGPADRQPDGQQTMTWASTIPYRNGGFDLPPAATLRRLPPDGVVIDVQLYGPIERSQGHARPPYEVEHATREYPWEGQVRTIPLYSLGGRVPGQTYETSIWVFFGRLHPTAAQIAEADAELARLQLPDWQSSR